MQFNYFTDLTAQTDCCLDGERIFYVFLQEYIVAKAQ